MAKRSRYGYLSDDELYKTAHKEVNSHMKSKYGATARYKHISESTRPGSLSSQMWKTKPHRFKYNEDSGGISRRNKMTRKDAKYVDKQTKHMSAGIATSFGGLGLIAAGDLGPFAYPMLKTTQNKLYAAGAIATIGGGAYALHRAGRIEATNQKYPFKKVGKYYSPALSEHKERNRVPSWYDPEHGANYISSSKGHAGGSAYYYRTSRGRRQRVKKGKR